MKKIFKISGVLLSIMILFILFAVNKSMSTEDKLLRENVEALGQIAPPKLGTGTITPCSTSFGSGGDTFWAVHCNGCANVKGDHTGIDTCEG